MQLARRVLSLSVGAFLVLAMSAPAFPQRTSDLRAEAFRLYDAGRFRESLPFFDGVLARKPKDLEALNRRGTAHLRLNQPDLALADFDRYLQINPRFGFDYASSGVPATADAWTNRGIALVMLDRDDEAMLAFRRAINLHRSPVNRHPAGLAADYCGVGQIYHRKGNDPRALDSFALAVKTDPSDPNGYVGQGLALAGLGIYDSALASYGEALRLDPNHSRAYGCRAGTLERLGRLDEALRDYDQSILLDPNAGMTHRFRGALLSRIGRQEDAAGRLRRRHPSRPQGLGSLERPGRRPQPDGRFLEGPD